MFKFWNVQFLIFKFSKINMIGLQLFEIPKNTTNANNANNANNTSVSR